MRSVKANKRPAMEYAYGWKPSCFQLSHSRPVQVVPLAATT
jgi:hypothetical protein